MGYPLNFVVNYRPHTLYSVFCIIWLFTIHLDDNDGKPECYNVCACEHDFCFFKNRLIIAQK